LTCREQAGGFLGDVAGRWQTTILRATRRVSTCHASQPITRWPKAVE
jgi:hypothetical protein